LTKEIIQYLHVGVGFPTKALWLKAIHAGNCVSWPGLSIKTVNRHFLESGETQKRHMKGVRQGVRLTKPKLEEVKKESDGEI